MLSIPNLLQVSCGIYEMSRRLILSALLCRFFNGRGAAYEQVRRPTHLALYDLQQGKLVDEIPLEPHGIGVVFSLLPAP